LWKDEDGIIWAKVLVEVKKALGEELDRKYLLKRARAEQIEEMLEEVLRDAGL
jgi:hypothetical protein